MSAAPSLDRRYTPEELLQLEDGTKYELIDGYLVERDMSVRSVYIAARFLTALMNHVEAAGLGQMYGADLQVRAFPWAPNLVRRPDVGFVRRDRVPAGEPGFLHVAPDAVVEVVSLHDGANGVRDKVDMWLRAGVRLVWVAYPTSREIYVYRPGAHPEVFTADDTITGEDVIPGFSAPVASLFPAPEPQTA